MVEQLGKHLSVALGATEPAERVDRRQAHLRARQGRYIAGQPEHTCPTGRGWRPPCACSGAGGGYQSSA